MAAPETRLAAHAWDTAAAGWRDSADILRQWLLEPTRRMLDAAALRVGDNVLDVAAGAGDQTLDILERVGPRGKVSLADISPGILALAREALRQQDGGRLRYVVADAQALGLSGSCFDAAVCRLGLMFCQDPRAALREIHAAVRSGGRLAGLVFSEPAANPCVLLAMRTAARHAGQAARDPGTPGALFSLGRAGLLDQLLQHAGFSDIQVTPMAAPFRLPSAARYVEFLRSSGSPIIEVLRALSPERQELAWADIAQQLEQFGDTQGWLGPNELLLFSARRPL
jgi:ubiquinone/menaquinone biosynthesis C-methylase UbiE